MFGWLFRKTETSMPFKVGEDGRPRPPHFPGLLNAESVTPTDLTRAIEWSIEWTKAEHASVDELFQEAKARLNGAARRKNFKHANSLDMTVRIVRQVAQNNRAFKSRRALPWVVFRTGPQEEPCKAALTSNGALASAEVGFNLPLDGCDQSICKCHTRGITKRELAQTRNDNGWATLQ
ncbi:hypothetical protein [Aliiroseovarius lamellibrachiae]|uniref:hypothetical protein n=1 Tax=Aliiroseovarius lamellibrachiae TaxID=1924933 RepID=UPI001BE0AC19|nr:hypothetical protein [Aliiroseovarius lamellibrachiae]MBT2131194.1 hypothetical protein [Aliiroseovarius lamellibrachiae]